MNIYFWSIFFACPQPPPAATTSTKNIENQQANQNAGQQKQSPNQQGQPNGEKSAQPSKGPNGENPNNPTGKFGYPEATGEIIQKAIIIKINDSGNGDPPPKYTQAELKERPNVTFSGKIICNGEGCDSPFVLRAVPFQEQSPSGNPLTETMGGLITVANIEKKGNFSILVPKSKKPIVLELLVDNNKDGKPTVDERLAVLEKGGQLIPYEKISDLEIDCSPIKNFGPIGGPVSPDAPLTPKEGVQQGQPEGEPAPKGQRPEGKQPPEGQGENPKDGQNPPPQEGQNPPDIQNPPPQEGQNPPPKE